MNSISRRRMQMQSAALKIAAALSLSQALLFAQESNLDKLANLRFLGNVQFKYNDELVYAYHPQQGQVGAPYPWHFFISPKSRIPGGTFVTDGDTAFGLSVGSYTGGVKGYWVRYPALPVIRLAWQALPPRNSGSCRLSFWNEDQQAHGNPEDAEMFYFEIVDPAKSTVKIKSRYCKYLHLDGDTFNPGAEAAEAAVFTVVFLDPSLFAHQTIPRPHVNRSAHKKR